MGRRRNEGEAERGEREGRWDEGGECGGEGRKERGRRWDEGGGMVEGKEGEAEGGMKEAREKKW